MEGQLIMGSEQVYSRGDWIVHRYYGVGQIKGIDVKKLEGQEVACFKVRTKDSTYWLPVDKIPNSRIRPVISSIEFKRLISILQGKPCKMDSDYKKRGKRIKEVEENGSLKAFAELIRDLSALQAERGLNTTDERALERLSKRFISEWSVCMKVDFDDAHQKLYRLLEESNISANEN
jgi:RNA polymerase-interacting CarD/CdnL/TRCF family regulator